MNTRGGGGEMIGTYKVVNEIQGERLLSISFSPRFISLQSDTENVRYHRLKNGKAGRNRAGVMLTMTASGPSRHK